jgi:spore coat protein H
MMRSRRPFQQLMVVSWFVGAGCAGDVDPSTDPPFLTDPIWPYPTDSSWNSHPPFPSDDPSLGCGVDSSPHDPFSSPEVAIDGEAPEPANVELPLIPRALTAYPRDQEILVRWWPVEEAEGYALYRASRPRCTPEHAARVEVSQNAFLDAEVPAGKTYWYAVAAIIDGEEQPLSGEVRGVSVESVAPIELHIEMAPTDLSSLYSRSSYSDVPLPASLQVLPNDVELDTEGIRFRGAGSRRYAKKGFNLRLTDRPTFFNFHGLYRDGADRLLLSAMWTDGTALREKIAFDMYKELGRPSPDTYFASVFLNGNYEGFYTAIERVDREALRGWGLNRRRGEMTLVRDDFKNARRAHSFLKDEHRTGTAVPWHTLFSTHEERIAFLKKTFDWRGEVEDQDWDGLLDMLMWANQAEPGSDFAIQFRQRFNDQAIYDFLALHAMSQDYDSLDTDYWMYRDEAGDNQWIWIPWDTNLTFGSLWTGDFLGGNNFFRYDFSLLSTRENRVVEHLLATPELYEEFAARLLDLVDNHFTPEWMAERIEESLPLIAREMDRRSSETAFVRHPRQHAMDTGYLPHQLEQLVEFMDLRRRWLHVELDRRAGVLRGKADVGRVDDVLVGAGKRHCAADRQGRTIGCITPNRAWAGTFEIGAVQDPDIDGVRRRYEVRLSRPLEGTLTLFYQNSTGRNWLQLDPANFTGSGDVERYWAGKQWTIEAVVATADGKAERVRSFVNPMVNRVEADVDLAGGVHTVTLPFGR